MGQCCVGPHHHEPHVGLNASLESLNDNNNDNDVIDGEGAQHVGQQQQLISCDHPRTRGVKTHSRRWQSTTTNALQQDKPMTICTTNSCGTSWAIIFLYQNMYNMKII